MFQSFVAHARRPRFQVLLAVLLVVGAMLASVSVSAAAPPAASGSSATSSLAANAALANGLQLAATPTPIALVRQVVPDCHFLSRVACETLLVAHGLRLGTVSFLLPQGPPPFIGSHVVSQSPAAGTWALRGTAVNITIEPVGRPF
jgi:hypothetical protein